MHHSITENAGKGPVEASRASPGEGGPASLREGGTPAPGGSLGITAKSSPPPSRDIGARAARAQRYQALFQARSWIVRRFEAMPEQLKRKEGDGGRVKVLAYPGDVFRTADCRHTRTDTFVEVRCSPGLPANYRNLATCGSVWACPVCAAVIQERRRLELEQLVEWAEAQSFQAVMVTFTFPHTSFDSLAELLARQADAFKRFRRGSPFTKFKAAIGFQGLVRSLEVTHGKNGWHPHTHELWVVDPSVGGEIRSRLVELWERSCIAAGLLDPSDLVKLEAFRKHSVDVRNNATSGEYLAKQDSSRKWGITHEVAKASSKAGKAKGLHPHEFLLRNAKGDEARYFEYLEAMKGKRQLFWSHGLKDRVGLDEVSDEDSSLGGDDLDMLGRLGADDWEFIRAKRLHARVLDAAEIGGWDRLLAYLKHCGHQTDRPPPQGDNHD